MLFLANGFGVTVGTSENQATSVVNGVFRMNKRPTMLVSPFLQRASKKSNLPDLVSDFVCVGRCAAAAPRGATCCCFLNAQSRCSTTGPISDTPPAL